VIGENFVKNVENYLRKAEKTLTSFYLGRGRPYYKEMLKVVAAAQEITVILFLYRIFMGSLHCFARY
jgi:hypothetical protein